MTQTAIAALAVVIGFASGMDRLEVGRLMDWQHHHGTIGDLREDLQDSPAKEGHKK